MVRVGVGEHDPIEVGDATPAQVVEELGPGRAAVDQPAGAVRPLHQRGVALTDREEAHHERAVGPQLDPEREGGGEERRRRMPSQQHRDAEGRGAGGADGRMEGRCVEQGEAAEARVGEERGPGETDVGRPVRQRLGDEQQGGRRGSEQWDRP